MNLFDHFIDRRFRRDVTGLSLSLLLPLLLPLLLLLLLLLFAPSARADMTIYADSLQNGWQDWSSPTNIVDWQSTAYVHSGSYAAAVTLNPTPEQNNSFLFAHDVSGFDVKQFASLDFWINGGASGGEFLGIQILSVMSPVPASYFFAPPTANTWQHVSVPLDLIQGDPSVYVGFLFLTAGNQPVPTFYLDDIKLVSIPEPTIVTLLGAGLLSVWLLRSNRSRPLRPAN